MLGPQSRALRCAGGSFGGGANMFSSSFLSTSFGVAQGGLPWWAQSGCITGVHCCSVSKELQRRGLCGTTP